jgi:hypothetical protein
MALYNPTFPKPTYPMYFLDLMAKRDGDLRLDLQE